MKRSLATSAVFHILVLIGAMVTLSAPAPLETPESTAMDVDIVTADQLQQGEKKAPVTDHVSRKQTTKQDQVANAQNVGENKVDIKNPVVPTQRPESDTAALAPKKVDAPVPQDDPRPNDAKTIEQQETEAAPKEVAAIPQQKPDVTPTPTPKADPPPPTPKADATPTPPPTEQPTQQAEIPTPNNVPVPVIKPQPTPPKVVEPKQETTPATKPDTKVAAAKPTDKTATQSISKEKSVDDGKKDADKKRESAKGAKSTASDFNEDQISAMLNNTSSKGGAKRSSQQASAGADTQVASRGGMKSLGGGKLSQSQKDGLRDLIAKNWNVVPGMEGASDVKIKVHVRLDKSGQIVGAPEVAVSGGPATTQEALRGAAERAVLKSRTDLQKEVNGGGLLPPDKYDGADGWNELVLNFDPRDLGL
ncbi:MULTISPECIES: hypothetical protein [Rhizobium]|uniref:Cell division and transport-associated protein TolA n=1 Tax=Rhizobium miluonense TaxID=411945 RepID=A0A1C3VU19_9HYPH|nr:hypothetical protein [Rhizobium miluonense]SCB31208.1 hypothetical protein GA0061102_10185 [Rhizobium miluonense]